MATIRNRREFLMLLVVACVVGTLSSPAAAQSREQTMTAADALGARARQAMIDIFREKDTTAVDRYWLTTRGILVSSRTLEH